MHSLQNRVRGLGLAALLLAAPLARGMERVTLQNGAIFNCIRHESVDGRVRLYLQVGTSGENAGYTDVAPTAIALVETVPDLPLRGTPAAGFAAEAFAEPAAGPSSAEISHLLCAAGSIHHIDAELLASVVHAESGGHVHALSRTGAQGLMQLMPGTAAAVGVKDAFVAADNVEGGARYLDSMLTRYHDNIGLALAAYNAGPGAVDQYHEIPPFRETRAYVTRVIREFNRRKTELLTQQITRPILPVKSR